MRANNISRRLRYWLAPLLLGLIAAVCWGETLTSEARQSRFNDIARKSEADRTRLQRNFKTFRSLPIAEQERLRQFARDLKNDDRGEGKLRRAFNDYQTWLLTITPGQAEDLRREEDAARRERGVREIVKKQQEAADSTGSKSAGQTPQMLKTKDLEAVIEIVEQAIGPYLNPEELAQLNKKHGVTRHAFALELAFHSRVGGAGAGVMGLHQWWKPEVYDKMVQAISNRNQKHRLETMKDQGGRIILLQMMMAGIKAEYEVEHEKLKPNQEMLERFFVQLSASEQDEIMRLPFDRQTEKLTEYYFVKKAQEDPDQFPKPPQFLWLERIKQQQLQRGAANRATPGPAGESGKDSGENPKRKNGKKKEGKGASPTGNSE